MKKILTFFTLVAGLPVFAQTYSDTATFSDGTQVPYYLLNGNNHPPKYSISIIPITVMFLELEGYASAMFTAQGFVRLNEKMAVDGRFSIPYGAATDAIARNSSQKGAVELQAGFNYLIGSRSKEREGRVFLASKASSDIRYDAKLYAVKFPMENITNYYISGGLNFLRTTGNRYQVSYTDSTYSDYFIGNASSVSIMAGITRERCHNYVYSSPFLLNKVKNSWRRVRNYAYLTYAPMVSYSVFANEVTMMDARNVEVNTGFTEPDKFRKIGWRIGSEIKVGIKPVAPFLGIEMGRVHGIRESVANDKFYGSLYFMLKAGIEFGPKTKPAQLSKGK